MTGHEYLRGILNNQTVPQDALNSLQSARQKIENDLRTTFGSSPRFYYAGSYGKKTMIREAFDLDIVIYFQSTHTRPLRDIYNSVYQSLYDNGYTVTKKTVSLNLPYNGGFYIDVVPGRAQNTDYIYATLYKNGFDSTLQTSLKVHIDSVRNYRDIIKIMKLWRIRHQVPLKSFAMEQLVIRALNGRASNDLGTDTFNTLIYVANNISEARLVDPANSNNIIDISSWDRGIIKAKAQSSIAQDNWSKIIW